MSMQLSDIFYAALQNATKALDLPTIEDSTQELIQSSLNDLKILQSRITGLALFSPNEMLDDVSTRDLVYLLVPYVAAELRSRVKTLERDDRIGVLRQTQTDLSKFLGLLDTYEVVPAEERALYEQKASAIRDPARRREVKVKQYQKEKDIRARIETLRKRRRQAPITATLSSSSPIALIASILPSQSNSRTGASKRRDEDDDEESDFETEDILRETTLLLLRLCYTQAQGQLESLDQELELLRSAPPPPPPQPQPKEGEGGRTVAARTKEDETWRLDAPRASPDARGALLDASGKPLQPFTILPSGTADRAQLQGQVFRPGYNLPTMTVDEYLQIERERGNILTGGGKASETELTSAEKLALQAEMEGTAGGEEKAEEKRQKDEKWAEFTDVNPRGAGNTMNRG